MQAYNLVTTHPYKALFVAVQDDDSLIKQVRSNDCQNYNALLPHHKNDSLYN